MKTKKRITALLVALSLTLSLAGCGGTQSPADPQTPQGNTAVPEGSTFTIEFFDVGQGDAALVECDGKYMLIDGGNKADSQKMYAILKEKEVGHLEYVVATNINAEHIGGLAGALNYATAGITLCPTDENDTDVFNDFKKYADKNGGGITVPSVGNKYKLSAAEIEIVGVNAAEGNDSSIILKITYGNTAVLFTGDAENIAEKAMLDKGTDIKANVLKIANHGGDKSTSSAFLRAVGPDAAVISSAGAGGYPGEETLSLLEIASVKVYRTDLQGDITLTSDGTEITFITEKEAYEEDLYKKGAASVTVKEQEKEAEVEKTEPEATKSPETKPVATPTPTPVPNPTVNVSADELYEANLMTNLVSAYGSVKTSKYHMNANYINGYFMVGDKIAYLSTVIDMSGQCSYSGWYNGYNFYDNGTRIVQQVYVENLEGDKIIPGQQNIASFFMNHEDVEYIGRDGEDFIFRANVYPQSYTLTVDSMSFAVKKASWGDGPYDCEEYIYGEWVEGQDILGWSDGSPLKMISIYADIYENGERKSYYMPLYVPETWEVEIDSYVHDVDVYMDGSYTTPYSYPGDGVSCELYVTNSKG